MGLIGNEIAGRRAAWNPLFFLSAAVVIILTGGCGNAAAPTPPLVAAQTAPQTYLAPIMSGATTDGVSPFNNPQIYTIDDIGKAYSQTSYSLSPPRQEGAQLLNSGSLSTSSRGLVSLTLTAHYVFNNSTNVFSAVASGNPGGSAVELAGQAGGLIQLLGQPVAPIVPTTACPNIPKAQTFNFLTIRTFLPTANSAGFGWNPSSQTAYGSVDITSTGSSVKFTNIHQPTFPTLGASGTPSESSPASVHGTCGRTAFGNTISIPGQIVVTDPGIDYSSPPQAIASIGPTGMLVEDNGLIGNGTNSGHFENTLGAGTGAVGLPKPTSPVDTPATVGAQYLGFAYGTGVYSNAGPPAGLSSHLVSFGFSNAPSNCASVAPSATALIYGGDFTRDDPTTSPDGFGNCDLAVDLGAQSTSHNGLYPNATVWMGQNYSGNATSSTYSFPAVAIVGQLQGKSAVFFLGVDSQQAWAIYLLQSN